MKKSYDDSMSWMLRVRPDGNGLGIGMAPKGLLTTLGWQFEIGANWFVVCRCECGTICVARAADIKRGFMLSCGCRRRAVTAINGRLHSTTHNHRNTRLYGIWRGIKKRCLLDRPSYSRYHGSGISVCDEWLMFEPFLEWSNSHGYDETKTIDRFPNRRGNYEPGNCRWATTLEQQRNKDTLLVVDFRGERRLLVELCDEFQIKSSLVRARIRRQGWDLERALSTKPLHLQSLKETMP